MKPEPGIGRRARQGRHHRAGTPNGQAAFLVLLTSALAPLIQLSYLRMVMMALPYTISMTITGLLCVTFLLEPLWSVCRYGRDS
jgi:Na+/H+ antiporter NhaB